MSTMIAGFYVLPIDDFFTLGPYEVLLLRGQDAQRVLLTCPGLAVDDVRTLVHIDCTLGKRAGLKKHREKVVSGKVNRRACKSLHMVCLLTQSAPA